MANKNKKYGNKKSSRSNGGSTVKVQESGGSTFIPKGSNNLIENFGNLNYSYLPGSPLYRDWIPESTSLPEALPGLLGFDVIPTIGIQKDASDPINLVSAQIYSKLRSVNSGAKNYDPNNVIIHIMAMDSIYSFHAWMMRVYGTIGLYTKSNYYYPEMLLQAMRIDSEDLRANYKQLKGYIDLFAKRANTLVIPDIIPLIGEHARLFNKVYTDARSIISQNYMFNPAGFYHYIENEEAGVKFGSLEWEWFEEYGEDGILTFQDIVNFGDHLLNDILQSDDMAIICGDIRKAYSESNLMVIPQISDDYTTTIEYDENVLLAIRNADTLNVTYGDDGIPNSLVIGDITANPTNNNVTQEILYKTGTSANTSNVIRNHTKHLIDQHKESPTIEDNYTAARFKFGFTGNPSSDDSTAEFSFYGSELLMNPYIMYFDRTVDGIKSIYTLPINTIVNTSYAGTNLIRFVRDINLISTFDMAPTIYVGSASMVNTLAQIGDCIPLGEIYNPTLVDATTLRNMFVAYFMSAFGVE